MTFTTGRLSFHISGHNLQLPSLLCCWCFVYPKVGFTCAPKCPLVVFLGLCIPCCSVTKSCLTLRPHGLPRTGLSCPSLSPRACLNSCPLSWWCYPTISSSVGPFSSGSQPFPASGSFPMSRLFASGGQSIRELQLQSFQWIFRVYFL